jgi:hypothetical protein
MFICKSCWKGWQYWNTRKGIIANRQSSPISDKFLNRVSGLTQATSESIGNSVFRLVVLCLLVGGNHSVPRRWWYWCHPVCSEMYVHCVRSMSPGRTQPVLVIVHANEI